MPELLPLFDRRIAFLDAASQLLLTLLRMLLLVLAVRIVGRLSVLSTVAFHLTVVEEDIASPHFVSYGVDSAAKLAGNPPKRPLVLPTGLYDDAFRKCQVRPFPAGHISGRL